MGKFDRMFARPAGPQPVETHPAFRLITPAMKSILLDDDDDQDRLPARRFVVLSHGEAGRHAETPLAMWVEVRKGRAAVRRTLWVAPDEATYLAANHNDPAPSDEALMAAGWHRGGGAPVESGTTE